MQLSPDYRQRHRFIEPGPGLFGWNKRAKKTVRQSIRFLAEHHRLNVLSAKDNAIVTQPLILAIRGLVHRTPFYRWWCWWQ
jgi:hypothetical protein